MANASCVALPRASFPPHPLHDREIIADESPTTWSAPLEPPELPRLEDAPVLVHIEYADHDLQLRIKAEGGRWQPTEKAWKLPYRKAVRLGLDDRIVGQCLYTDTQT